MRRTGPWPCLPSILSLLALAQAPAAAAEPAALVEDISAEGLEIGVMDYVTAGQTIVLKDGDTITLGYLASCLEEKITGGSITVGERQSKVVDGKVDRARVLCSGESLELTSAQKSKSAAAVFRKPPTQMPNRMKPDLVVHGVSPIVTFARPTTVLRIERLDRPGPELRLPVTGRHLDLAGVGEALQAGGLYRFRADDVSKLVKISPSATSARVPTIARLVRL